MNLRKFRKIATWFFGILLFLILSVWIFIHTTFGQNWIVGKVTARLSKDLHTTIEIKHVDFSLFNNMHLEGLLIRDHTQDTLLYAGDAKVRITDWFFFKNKVELKSIGLENAVIKMQRSDSVWNHQFLVDYFSSSSSSKKDGGTSLNIKQLDFKNITFIKKDGWTGQDMKVTLSSLQLDANEISVSGKTIDINSLNIVDPFVSLYDYPGNKPDSQIDSTSDNTPVTIDSLLKWNAAGWVMKTDKLEIKNGTFRDDKYTNTPAYTYFDGRHFEFNHINSTFTNLRWEKDTITTNLVLQTKERSGFEVKNMKANVKLTPNEMAFTNLEIKTNNSVIRDYFRMSYNDISDMDDFLHAVKMQANFNNSEIDSDDIAFFAPEVKSWKKNITLKGDVRGTVDDLFGKKLIIQAGNNTSLNGDISLTGLPDINQTFIDFKANDFRTTYTDATAFVPALRNVTSPNLRAVQYMRFTGSFTGFIRDFVTFGTLQTNLGVVKSDVNMKLPTGHPPLYSGTISTDYFRLGEFINDPAIGIVSLNGSLKGKGFDPSNRQANLDGQIKFIDYKGYRYTNIALNGILDKKKFDGKVSINDPEAELTLNGLIDFNNKIPTFNFLADVKKANLKNLKLTNRDIAFSGKFNLNFTGDNIDNFLGRASITDASLLRNGNPLPFDSLTLSSEYIGNSKVITISSNELDATVKGDFNIRDLPDAFKLFLNKYYPAYVKAPKKNPDNESLSFDINTRYVDDYVKLIDSSMSGFNNSHIAGSLNTSNNQLVFTANVPQFKYKSYD
ncbi:MAG: AsmA family protein, partial [Chitinophagaceae bacterium]